MMGGIAISGTSSGFVNRDHVLTQADAMLHALQLSCGGQVPGPLAMPELAAACAQARHLDMRIARTISVAGDNMVTRFWAQISPQDDGLQLSLLDWREVDADTLPAGGAAYAIAPDDLAGADARLTVNQSGQLIGFDAGDDSALDAHLAAHLLQNWTKIFAFPGLDTRFAADAMTRLPWTAFDQQEIGWDGRGWKLAVSPNTMADGSAAGAYIGLHLLRAPPPTPKPTILGNSGMEGIFGRQLGPALRQPIGRIIANAETIGGRLQGPIRSDYANYAQDIATAGRHLLELVEDLTDMEAVEKTGFSVAHDEIDLADLARRAAGLLAIKAADHQIRIDTPDHDETLPAIGEFRRVLQILLNLITNAIRYAPDGSMIWLRLEEAGGRAQVIVADQGPGIALDQQAVMFEKFERLGRSGDGGSGLGLYISRRLADAMGGSLTVDSAPGQGARFILELPGR